MKKSLVLALTDEELCELYRIILDGDQGEALRFLRQHFKDKAKAAIEGKG